MKKFTPLIPALSFTAVFLVLWQLASTSALGFELPSYILPAPLAILRSFAENFTVILEHSLSTLLAASSGLVLATVFALVCAVCMQLFTTLYRTLYPLVVLSQSIPLIALAPLFILWFGFGFLPKLVSVIVLCFFPIVLTLLKQFKVLQGQYADLLRSFGASNLDTIWHVMLPGSAQAFFAGLRIASTYAVVAAVIGEWLGGAEGIGVFLIRSQKSFATAQLFAAILAIMLLSLFVFSCVILCEGLYLRKFSAKIEE